MFLEDDGADAFWGRAEENGGDWFELVVITDRLDMRAWQFIISDESGDPDQTLTLTDHDIWSDLRSGTILTVSEELGNNADSYNPAVGQWWLNVKAADDTNGTFITASNFRVNNSNWQLTITDASGVMVFGPAGEGINPVGGVSGQEVLKLEENPGASITPFSNYNDGQSSSFGSPNIWNGGTDSQDFSALRGVVPYFALTAVRINEVLTHTDSPAEDWIELHNTADSPIDVGGWYLSDDVDNLAMSQIEAGGSIPAQGYLLIYEHELNFALSAAHGDQVYLCEVDSSGAMTGLRDFVEFGAAENNVSFGRYPNGTGALYPMTEPTEGAPNADPLVGPIVINEIMYHPPDLAGGLDNIDHEFVELHNITSAPVDLFTYFADVDETHPWRLVDGVSFAFAFDTTVAACGYLVVVSLDPATEATKLADFRATYGLDESVPIVGPYVGKLSNSGETVRLRKPDPPQGPGHTDEGLVPYVLVDEVPYSDHDPWPTEPGNQRCSLERIVPSSVGDVATNWAVTEAAGGTPGTANSVTAPGYCEAHDDTQSPSGGDADVGTLGPQARGGGCGFIGPVNLAFAVAAMAAMRFARRSRRSTGRQRLAGTGSAPPSRRRWAIG